jgi:hypothetical protein
MFRPDPNGAHSVEQVIAKLTDILTDVPHDSPRAQKLAEMIRGLEDVRKEQAAKAVVPLPTRTRSS